MADCCSLHQQFPFIHDNYPLAINWPVICHICWMQFANSYSSQVKTYYISMANDWWKNIDQSICTWKLKVDCLIFHYILFLMRANKNYTVILSQKPKPFIRGDVNYYLGATSAKNLKMQQGTSIIFAIVNKHRGNALRSLTCIDVHGYSKCPSHPLEAILGKEKKVFGQTFCPQKT